LQEISDLFAASYGIKDLDAKVAARGAVVTGPLKPKFERLTKILVRQPCHGAEMNLGVGSWLMLWVHLCFCQSASQATRVIVCTTWRHKEV
jgi:hypothetical protein